MTVIAAASNLSGPLLVVGAIVVAFTIGRALARKGGASSDGTRAADDVRADEQVERIEEAGGRVLQEIEQLGKETVARAETRLRVLSELLQRAERAGAVASTEEGGELAGRFDEVYRLAGEGLDANQIAERTAFERGEIDLILSLRAKSRGQTSTRKESGAS